MNSIKFKYVMIPLFLFLLSSFENAQSQEDDSYIQNKSLSFLPNIAGGQIEFTTLIVMAEIGTLFDIDFIQKKSKIDYSFGTRLSFEHFAYFISGGPPGGGPFTFYNLFSRLSIRSEYIHVNILGGISYHNDTDYTPNKTLFRVGYELRLNIINKYVALLFKSSTSFDKRTGYLGFGIAVGYYK